ncbi:MAG: hypothetical protein ACI814_004183, partial [Mariniblastus sp.]
MPLAFEKIGQAGVCHVMFANQKVKEIKGDAKYKSLLGRKVNPDVFGPTDDVIGDGADS